MGEFWGSLSVGEPVIPLAVALHGSGLCGGGSCDVSLYFPWQAAQLVIAE